MIRPVVLGVILLGALLPVLPASAAASSCSALKARLSSLAPAGAAPTQAERQSAELSKARALEARCAGSQSAACAALPAIIASMKKNLSNLQRAPRPRPRDTGAERASILRALAKAKCNEAPAAPVQHEAERPAAPFNFFSLFATPAPTVIDRAVPQTNPADVEKQQRALAERRETLRRLNARAEHAPVRMASLTVRPPRPDGPAAAPPWPRLSGTFRTVCVRSCDGYFWPISYSTSSRGFSRDEDMCRAACPNMEVSLYVHRNPGSSTENAFSRSGTPYHALPTAFRYRERYNAACSCRPAVPATPALREGDAPQAPLNETPVRDETVPPTPGAPPTPEEEATRPVAFEPPTPDMDAAIVRVNSSAWRTSISANDPGGDCLFACFAG